MFTHGALLRSYFKKKNSLERVRASQIELEFGSVGFKGDGKTGLPGEKTLGARKRTNNTLKTQPTYGVDARVGTQATFMRGENSHHCPCATFLI